MKILIPYYMHNNATIESGIVAGGVERFIKHIYETFDSVALVPIDLATKKNWRKVYDIMVAAINEHNPDLVVCNYLTNTLSNKIAELDIPVIWICHHNIGGFSSLNAVQNMQKFPGHIYMVSDYQASNWQKLSQRVCGKPLSIFGIITPSYVEKPHTVENEFFTYGCATIGRACPDKHPFLLYDRVRHSNIRTVTYTNKENLYYLDKWLHKVEQDCLHTVHVDMLHRRIMEELPFSQTFFVTWPDETFGIIALEALSRGVPVILNCNNTMKHASECIVPNAECYRKVPNLRSKAFNVVKAINELSSIYSNKDDRQEIADLTYAEFNRNAWKMRLEMAFDMAVDMHKKNGLIFQ